MDLGTALSVVQTLFDALQCQELREMCSFLGYKSQLEDLQMTVETVRKVLLDAEAQPHLTNQAKQYIEQLKDAVYDADDLIDEFITVAERKHKQLKEGGKVSQKVRLFFSKFKELSFAYNMSHAIKEIRKRLDNIASNHNKFGFKLDSQPIRRRREETCSYVNERHVIGREDDKENIVNMLLDHTGSHDISFLSIVGIGGLGKTTLAQLVYNDERVVDHFDLRLWTCVSDQDQEKMDVGSIIVKILESATRQKNDGLIMDEVQRQLQVKIARNKYLIILDDVWNENRMKWLDLENLLKEGLEGSRVIVTTRSRETARIVGDGTHYELKGLSEKDSWDLFERIAFGEKKGQENYPLDLVEIGRKIVKKCVGVPLAIKVIGSLLYGQDKTKWLSFQETELAKVDNNDIMHVLKLSYHHLESPLKSCFSYSALFPKDYRIEKEMFIMLWIAQGYIVPSKERQLEDVANEYFLILVRRCLFQEVKSHWFDEQVYYQIHDLMHDIAQEVAGKDITIINSFTNNVQKTRHLSSFSESIPGGLANTKLRTCLLLDKGSQKLASALLRDCTSLRTISLARSNIESLPDIFNKLVHLRYVDLSNNWSLRALPKSITKLYNLQALILSGCKNFEELPKDLSKLVKLRVLDLTYCKKLTHMPWGMDKLSCLHTMPVFCLGETSPSSRRCAVNELKGLTNLTGHLQIQIWISENTPYGKVNNSEGKHVRMGSQHLSQVGFRFNNVRKHGDIVDYEEALLMDLEPQPNLRRLSIDKYGGTRMPNWIAFIRDLCEISISDCCNLESVPSLRGLHNLRKLKLTNLNLEYMENTSSSHTSDEASDSSISRVSFTNTRQVSAYSAFFPSLEILDMCNLPYLKGWWREQPRILPSFHGLSELFMYGCPELTCMPLSPKLEKLRLNYFNKKLQIMSTKMNNEARDCGSTNSKLKNISTANVKGLKSMLPLEALQCLVWIDICQDDEVESLGEVAEMFKSCSSSLRFLQIKICSKLRSLSGGLEHLTALETLILCNVPNLRLEEEEEEEAEEDKGWPWSLHHSLRSLELKFLSKVGKLPKGMQYLTSLKSLEIYNCEALESIPEWMPKLTSLTRLKIKNCSESLMRRCQESPMGEDWPYIQHIPDLVLKHYSMNR